MAPVGDEPFHLILSVDFGETMSAICYALIPRGKSSEHILPEHVHTVTNYPNSPMDRKGDPMRLEVPTEMVYRRGRKFRSLAELISEQPEPTKDGPTDDMTMDPNYGIDVTGENEVEDHGDQPLWGEQAHEYFSKTSSYSDSSMCLVGGFKKMFDKSGMQNAHNDRIIENLRVNFGQGVPMEKFSPEKVIHATTVDYLTYILHHSKNHIVSKHEGTYGKKPKIASTETVICVPIAWSQKAYRNLQSCMTVAMKVARFPGVRLEGDIIDKVLLVSEPECGAIWLLSGQSEIRPAQRGENIVIIDSGGGTTDASTFKVTGELPKRLESQLVPHSGGTYGSSAIEQDVGELLRKRLKPHRYLEQNGITIEGIVQSLIHEFKAKIKPSWNIFTDKTNKYLDVKGLKPFPGERNIIPNQVIIRYHEINRIFLDVLHPIRRIMLEQLTASSDRGLNIDVKSGCNGGFADSPSYKEYLQRSLTDHNKRTDCTAKWYHPTMNTVINSVAAGGVIRAGNKANGPKRIARSSYGLGRYEPWDAKLHKGQTPIKGIHDGKLYARTIDWKVKLGEKIKHDEELAFECEYTFLSKDEFGWPKKGPFVLCDEIWVSDTASKSHLAVDGEHNKDSEYLGFMETDVTHLRGCFETRSSSSKRKRGEQKLEWLVLAYHLVFEINGLNMNCRQVLRFVDGTEIPLNNLKVSLAPGISLGAS
ncbi:hypothetical protein ACHAPJ_006255 [Fusarium lateritium]